MKASTITTIVALAIAGLNVATAHSGGFGDYCQWINYNNLIGDPGDNRSVIIQALCDRIPGRGEPIFTGLDLKTCLGWDFHNCNFTAPRGTADAFTRWCSACSIDDAFRKGRGFQMPPFLDCDCACRGRPFGRGEISLDSHIGNWNGTLVC